MWRSVQTFVVVWTSLLSLANAASTFSPTRPPAIPLAVRSPYLNTILYAGAGDGYGGGYLPGQVSALVIQNPQFLD